MKASAEGMHFPLTLKAATKLLLSVAMQGPGTLAASLKPSCTHWQRDIGLLEQVSPIQRVDWGGEKAIRVEWDGGQNGEEKGRLGLAGDWMGSNGANQIQIPFPGPIRQAWFDLLQLLGLHLQQPQVHQPQAATLPGRAINPGLQSGFS